MILGLTLDPVVAAAVAAGRTSTIPWPARWTDALNREGLGLPGDASRPIVGLGVLIHGGLGWSPAQQRQATQLGLDDRARGRIVARAAIEQLAGGRAQLGHVEAIAPVVATGDAQEPWRPSQTLRRRLGLGIAERPPEPIGARAAAEQAREHADRVLFGRSASRPDRTDDGPPEDPGDDSPAGAQRLWCTRCWRLVGVRLAQRCLVVCGAGLAAKAATGRRPDFGAILCEGCLRRAPRTMTPYTEIAAPVGATEDLTRVTLDRALAGTVAHLLCGSLSGVGVALHLGHEVPVVELDASPWCRSDRTPPRVWVGRVVAVLRGGCIVGVARLAAHSVDRLVGGRMRRVLVGQRPMWLDEPSAWREGAWLFDSMVSIEPFAWLPDSRMRLSGDLLLLLVERLRAQGARLVPWVRWPDDGWPLSAQFETLDAVDRLEACAVATMGLLGPEAKWARWRLVDGQLIGRGQRLAAPAPRAAWATLLREVRRRGLMTPAPYPIGPAPAGRYWVVGPDGPAFFMDHPGGEAEGVVWLARLPNETAGEAREGSVGG